MATQLDILQARLARLVAKHAALGRLLGRVTDQNSSEWNTILGEMNNTFSQISADQATMAAIVNTPAAATPASPAELAAIQAATAALHGFNVASGAVHDLFNVIVGLAAGLAAPAPGGAATAGAAGAAMAPPGAPPQAILQFLQPAVGGDGSPGPLSIHTLAIQDGRYRGGTPELAVELRVDAAVCGIISADLFRLDEMARRTWVAALRTVPDGIGSGPMEIRAEDRYDARSSGHLRLTAAGDRAIHAALRLDRPLDGLPFGREMAFTVDRAGDGMRAIGLEFELEEGVDPPPETNFNGALMRMDVALANAGIELIDVGENSPLPMAPADQGNERGGWSEKALEALMHDFAQTDLGRPAFDLHLLWLSRSNREGLLGVMFDTDEELPRQGLAVFAEEIRAFYKDDPVHRDRKLIQTTVHELGHALNLAHRFEREVGRADSTSFMNYDWRYRGGRRAAEFWRLFAYAFDSDELTFLRHAPYRLIVPGGAPFHTVRYWAEGTGGYSPYVPEEPLPGFELTLLEPDVGSIFAFGQPLLLGIRLTNRTGRRLRLPQAILDPKAGFLQILIRRITPGRRPEGPPETFLPITARCFEDRTATAILLDPDGSHEENLNLTFGAAGFAFAEPGLYDITAVLVVFDQTREIEMLAPSNVLRIRVAHPHDLEAERAADTVFRTDVGRWFALGAPERLDRARSDLLELLERSLSRKGDAGRIDAIATNIARSAMFGANRESYRWRKDAATLVKPDTKAAKRFAALLNDEALRTFDPITRTSTAAYAAKLVAPQESRKKRGDR